MPTTKFERHSPSEHEQEEIWEDIDAKHEKNVRKTGFAGARALKVQTSISAVGSDAHGPVERNLKTNDPSSISARAALFNENIKAWASPNTEVGAGRANLLGVVEQAEFNHLKDTGKNVWDKFKRRDGTANGAKLNDNPRRGDTVDGSGVCLPEQVYTGTVPPAGGRA